MPIVSHILLSIETSCDETSVAIVQDGKRIFANIIASQIKLHQKTGGVVPEVAAREHVVKLPYVFEAALRKAKMQPENINAIAVTQGPGLLSSLLIGVNAAMTLAKALRIPLIPVHHIEGHMYANWLETKTLPRFPIVVLTASGGHNELILWHGHGRYTFLGATLDDAAGEAFDKVARLLGLSYPGGPAIERAAQQGDATKYALPRAWVTEWDFSFSGLKTAVLRLVQDFTKIRRGKKLPTEFVADVAASFEEAVCDVLATKLVRAAQKYKAREVHLAGGVSANKRLRAKTQELLLQHEVVAPLRFCTDLKLCTDNAAMIGCAGYYKYKKNPARYRTWRPIIPDPNLKIKAW